MAKVEKISWFIVTEINGGEYESTHMIEAISVKLLADSRVVADGIEIRFGDPIKEISKKRPN